MCSVADAIACSRARTPEANGVTRRIADHTVVDFVKGAMLSNCAFGADTTPMSLLPFCQWLANTDGSIALHESLYMYPIVESMHVLTLCLFVGMTMIMDLRLTGLALRRVPASEVVERLQPWIFAGFFIMTVTGVLLFYAIPVRSYQNIFFRAKVVFLVLAGLNAWAFHTGVFTRVSSWGRDASPPARARLAGIASLVLWAGVIFAGRMIAYNWFDCDKPQPGWVQVMTGCSVNSPQ